MSRHRPPSTKCQHCDNGLIQRLGQWIDCPQCDGTGEDRKAFAGLRRRLLLRTQRAIDTARADGRWHEAERLAADHLRQREERRARDHAAAAARVPLGERISSPWQRVSDADGEVWGVISTGTV